MRASEVDLLRTAAATAGERVTTWSRETLLREARRQLAGLADRDNGETA